MTGDVAASLTNPGPGCKTVLLAAMLLSAAPAWTAPAAQSDSLRECVARATAPSAMAVCEQREQIALKARIEQLSAAIRNHLDNAGRAIFDRNQRAWLAFAESEAAMLGLSLGQRRDGLGAALRPAAVTLVYEERVRQLREHLHNLSLAEPPATRDGDGR